MHDSPLTLTLTLIGCLRSSPALRRTLWATLGRGTLGRGGYFLGLGLRCGGGTEHRLRGGAENYVLREGLVDVCDDQGAEGFLGLGPGFRVGVRVRYRLLGFGLGFGLGNCN